MDPLTAQGVGKMFRGTAGMQSRVVSPVTLPGGPTRTINPCPVHVGTISQAEVSCPPVGTQRLKMGGDPRGTSVWLWVNGLIEEYSFPGFSLLQSITGFASFDFWGGDGTGGIVYMDDNNGVARRDSGGTITVLLDGGTYFVSQATFDPNTSTVVVLVQTSFGPAPYGFTIYSITLAGSVTHLADITLAGTPAFGGDPVVTPDGAVWWTINVSGTHRLVRWTLAGGYSDPSLAVATVLAQPIPRPDNSVWIPISGVATRVAPDFTTSAVPCPDASSILSARRGGGQTRGARLVVYGSHGGSTDPWDIYKIGSR